MIRVAVFEPHPAARAGLERIVAEAPGLRLAGAAGDPRALWPLLYKSDPDVVVLGADRPAEALRLCLRTRQYRARSVVYAAGTGFDTIVPARFAGAQAVVDKAAPVGELLSALRQLGAVPCAGVGVGNGGKNDWREPGLFVTGLDFATLDALGRRFRQAAIVRGVGHGTAELRVLA